MSTKRSVTKSSVTTLNLMHELTKCNLFHSYQTELNSFSNNISQIAHCSDVCRLSFLSICTMPVLLVLILIGKGHLLYKFISDSAIRAHRHSALRKPQYSWRRGVARLVLRWLQHFYWLK